MLSWSVVEPRWRSEAPWDTLASGCPRGWITDSHARPSTVTCLCPADHLLLLNVMVCRKRLRFHKVCHEWNGGTRVTKRGTLRLRSQEISQQDLQTLLEKLRFQPDFIDSDLNDGESSVSKMYRDLLSFVSTQMRGRKKSFSWHWQYPKSIIKSSHWCSKERNKEGGYSESCVSALPTLGKLSRVHSTLCVLFPELKLAISFTDIWVKVRGDSKAHRSPWRRCWVLGVP